MGAGVTAGAVAALLEDEDADEVAAEDEEAGAGDGAAGVEVAGLMMVGVIAEVDKAVHCPLI